MHSCMHAFMQACAPVVLSSSCVRSYRARMMSSDSRSMHARAGWVARVGSAGFLCVQILMLLDFVTSWNDSWVDKEDDRRAL